MTKAHAKDLAAEPTHTTADGLSMFQRLRRQLTFVDLPIRRKFLLFAAGALFWFASMASVTVFSLTATHYKYHQIAERIIPHGQAANAVLAHLRSLDADLRLILEANPTAYIGAAQSARDHVKAIRTVNAALSLQQGAPAQTGTLVENFVRLLAATDPAGVQYLHSIMAVTDRIDHALDGVLTTTMPTIKASASQARTGSFNQLKAQIAEAIGITEQHARRIEEEYAAANDGIYQVIRHSVHATLAVLLVASLLLICFVRWIIVAFQQPISAIIQQIDSLQTGDIDLAKKVSIKSQDEIGTLSTKFNALVDNVYGMTIYKKVIEEDSSLDEIYHRLGTVFEDDLEIGEYTIYEVNAQSKEMHACYPPLIGDTQMHCGPEILTDCGQCRAVKTGHNVSSFEYPGICRRFIQEEGIGHVCIPLMADGNTSGVVQLRFPADPQGAMLDDETPQKLFNASTYINQSLSVIEAKRLMQTLRDSAMVDPLTGLYNRRFLQDHTKQLISGVLRRQKQIGLLVCDLDYFKQVNDTHGHDAGDLILKETSQVLKKTVRDSDIVIRFGGEEFLVLLLDVAPGDAMLVAEKIRAAVEKTQITLGDKVLQKTISIGVAEYPDDTEGFWQAIKYADVALYRAKDEGRNRAVRFTTEMWQHGDF
ncbi:MAG: GGDEF domain-containing protein [Rhodocyclaceae bacterium]|jgi:diguanylate cyclase (GGDEF)-like protein|nr:GGDEF domain-containing protein [Rhodocyclaceae bacterium]